MKIWEPKTPGTLWATPGLLWDSLYLFYVSIVIEKKDHHQFSRNAIWSLSTHFNLIYLFPFFPCTADNTSAPCDKCKGHPRTGHEGPEGEQRYISTLSLTLGGQRHAPAALPSGKRPGTLCIGGWVGPRSVMNGCGKSRPHRDSIPDHPTYSESLYHLSHPFPCSVW
jgi:hypothetical protein